PHSHFIRIDRPIIDGDGRVVAVVRPPPSADYEAKILEATGLLTDLGKRLVVGEDEYNHKRGSGYASINTGISHGQGSKKPARSNHGPNTQVIEELLQANSFRQLAIHQSETLGLYYPKCHQIYENALSALTARHPELGGRNYEGSVFPKAAFNFGGTVWSHKHIDTKNFTFGWCCITALGTFDHTAGGHLILWELGLILELPAGYTASILSSLIIHSNTPTKDGDLRYSFVQYFPGEIMRYVDNGCITDKGMRRNNKKLLERSMQMRKSHGSGYNYMAEAEVVIVRRK
ncbi:hypothetical protein CVT24_008148, partial [Panaeolus cyanescens]